MHDPHTSFINSKSNNQAIGPKLVPAAGEAIAADADVAADAAGGTRRWRTLLVLDLPLIFILGAEPPSLALVGAIDGRGGGATSWLGGGRWRWRDGD